jgi:hypothetical protein
MQPLCDDLIPEGWSRIARRFNAGTRMKTYRVPKGRLEMDFPSVVPSGLIYEEPQSRR